MTRIGTGKLVETHIRDLHLRPHTGVEETSDRSRRRAAAGSAVGGRSSGVNRTRNMNKSFTGCVRMIYFWFGQRLALFVTFQPREDGGFP